MWHTLPECRHYLDELLTDRRGARKGFPPDVMRDLNDLRNLHAALHAIEECHWDTTESVREKF
jgi:hypothetical protein